MVRRSLRSCEAHAVDAAKVIKARAFRLSTPEAQPLRHSRPCSIGEDILPGRESLSC
ncbi:MAG: hypothetical protein AW07_04741 [Candidatus Accumulibacter sp. SK-11]|nr:MAG: hypothetical protein AW07_04741 [Candidatus Accumulibacter sp. SK-11]